MTTTPTSGAADLPEALRKSALEIFDGPECSQDVRDAIEWASGFAQAWLDEADATHLRELSAYRLTVENLEREIAAQQPAQSSAAADTVVLEAALRAIHQAIDLIGEPDTERLRTVRRVLRGAVVVAEDCKAPQADSQPAPVHQVNYSVLYMYAERKRVDYNDLCATVHEAMDRAARATADSVPPPAEATNTKTHKLLSTTVGLLMGYREGAARQPYKPGSVIAKTVDEVVEHLKNWPYPEPAQAADSVLEDAARYLWLRATTNYVTSKGERIDVRNHPDLWDAVIDAARKQGGAA